MFWTVEDKCFWYCREGVVFFCNDPITTGSPTMHLAGKYNESFSVLTLKLIEYVLTCLVGVEDCKTECSWSESDLLNSGLSRSLPTFIGEQSAASTCRIFVMSSIFRFSILLTSVNRQSVYRKNCSLSQKAVIGSLNMLNIALINERFKPLCTARDYSKAEVQLQPQCLI